MTKIQDIIDFAQQTGIADEDFVATFDPEHIALMEAVCEAAVGYIEDRDWCVTALANAAHYLQAYRKERGLDGTE